MESGIPLYFKITAMNDGGLPAYSQCEIATYDRTPPMGRVTEGYLSTSDPSRIAFSTLMTEDSPIAETKVVTHLQLRCHGNGALTGVCSLYNIGVPILCVLLKLNLCVFTVNC